MNRKRLKVFNSLIPKKNNYIYALPHGNGLTDCFDLINFTGDNLLNVVHYMYLHYSNLDCVIFLECFSQDRMASVQKYIDDNKKGKLSIVPLLSHRIREDKKISYKRLLRNVFLRYRSSYWMSDSLYVHFYEKTKKQVYFHLNYSTPFKKLQKTNNDFFNSVDYFCDTSIIAATVHSSLYQIPLEKFIPLAVGFPRNDNLFLSTKENKIREWINKKTDIRYEKIVVYAPTYRDYKGAYDSGSVFGYADHEQMIEKYLEQNNILVISKMHPLQEDNNIRYSKNVIKYESNYDFTLYDLLAIADMLISDYSSVIHDFILTKKPILIDLFDNDRYDLTRGVVFDPIDVVYPSRPCYNAEQFVESLDDMLKNGVDIKKYQYVEDLFHRYQDANSTKRVARFIFDTINNHRGA